MFEILIDILWIFVGASGFILIIAGIFAALWIFQRLADVVSDEDSDTLPNMVKFFGFFGIFIGIVCLVTAAGGILLPFVTELSELPPDYAKMSFSTLLSLIGVGIILCVRPIKNVKWGALISLGLGVIMMIVIIVLKIFIFPHSDDIWLWVMVITLVGSLGGFYFSIKIFDTLTVLIGNILDSPPVAILAGVICVVEGILILLGYSIMELPTLFL